MARNKGTSGPNATGAATAPALEQGELERDLANADSPQKSGAVLSKIFHVRSDEVALLKLDNGLLKFLFPAELTTAGKIPISSSTAVAAHTAVSKKVELFNNFTRVKHASIFESIKPGGENSEDVRPATIHKLMSAPVLNKADEVLGVIQVCHKGFDLGSTGPDFTLDDLQQLERAAKALSQAVFMQSGK